VGEVVRDLGLKGPIATVTAGWEERESEVGELDAALGVPTFHLELYGRTERLLRRQPDILAILQERHDRMRRLQQLYRLRLDPALEAARSLLRRKGTDPILEEERRSAIDAVKRLDEHVLRRKRQLQATHEAETDVKGQDSILAERMEVADLVARSVALCIPGGHVGLIRNRLWLFDIIDLAGDRPILCWSAGAMALSRRIVLFHDSPPQGMGNAEVYEEGCGLVPSFIPLPHAHRRMRLDDPLRVALFARRFGPAQAVIMDDGARLDWEHDHFTHIEGHQRLSRDGTLVPMGEALTGSVT
jgi:hypothetical protein